MGENAVNEYLLTYLWTALEYIGATFLFDGFAARRSQEGTFWGRTVGFILLAGTGINLIMPATASYQKVLVALITYTVFYLVQYRSIVILSFFMAAIYYAIICCVDNVCYTFLFLFPVTNFTSTFLMPLVVRCLTILICYLQKELRTKHGVLPVNWRWYTVPTILSLGNVFLLFYYGNCSQEGQIAAVPLAVTAWFLMCLQVAALFLVSWMEQSARLREETLSLQTKSNAQQENIEALSEAYTQQRKLTHDFRAHLDLLANLLDRTDGARQARSYVRDLQKTTATRVLLVATHHAALDALLNQKVLLAQKRKIDIQCMVNDLSSLQIAMVDLTVILSNLFDNAIEACEKLAEQERQIRVQVLLEEGELFLSVQNRSLPVALQPGQLPPSTKENPTFHGYGLENVRTILKKYKALYTMEYHDGWFRFATQLPKTALS